LKKLLLISLLLTATMFSQPLSHQDRYNTTPNVDENNSELCQDFSDKDQLRQFAFEDGVAPGLMSKDITPFEWQVLEKVIMVCLYFKKEVALETLQQMVFERDGRLELTFRLQFGSLHQFVKRHGRVFFIRRNGNQKPDISLKIDFVRQLLLSRSGMSNAMQVEHNADMLIDEDLEKDIVRMAIQILYSQSQQNCTIGKLGQILHRRMNNPRLPRMFKHTYGGLKKFFERQSTIFCIKKDHLYNPIITLNKQFRALLEDQMAKDRENEERSSNELLKQREDKPSRSASPRNRAPTRPPLTMTAQSENIPKRDKLQEKASFRKAKTANWSTMVNPKPVKMMNIEDDAWLHRLPQQLS